jgi:2'-5' RNA ligase
LRGSKQRLFFALWPDAAVRDAIAHAAAPLVAACQSRAVPAANYHLTLAFLGALSPTTAADVAIAARGVRFAAFDLSLQQAGYWQRSRVAWFAPAGCPQALATLVDDLWNRLAGLGLALDSRQFRPHVTLARDIDEVSGMQLAMPVEWRVQSFALVESTASAAGVIYTVREEFPAMQ